jgi:4-hydroxyacetophenone monooxygenase
MPFEPIVATDDELRVAIAHADVVSLLPALAYATGDLSLLRDDLRVDKALIRQPDAGLTPEQLATAHRLAFDALRRLRNGEVDLAAPPSEDDLRRMIEFVVGDGADDDYLHLVQEELGGLQGEDLRAPRWHVDDVAPGTDFRVLVVGAGMSGLLAGHRLRQAGVAFTIVEKNHDVGGTWLENTYPGCRVDVANHVYSYSFAQRHDWPNHFSPQPVLLDYFRRCADDLGLRPSIRFGTEVVSCTWDEDTATWSVLVRTAGGAEETLTANVVVSAVGQLNRPAMPDIAGVDAFDGPSFHSARWDHDVDLDGKRVVVIGTGASACQLVPEIADRVADLTVFQRTPPWLVPSPSYHAQVPDEVRWLFAHVPYYAHWHRFWLFWKSSDGLLAEVAVDPSWDRGEESVSEANDVLRRLLTMYLEMQAPDDPDLVAAVTPRYPPGAKRVIFDDGIWMRTLQRDDVHLVTSGVQEVTADGVVDGDGVKHPADVIVYATGFQASRFLTPMRVSGRGGADLHEAWDGDARAHLGVTVPRFPNLFLLYGPNTNIVVNGSIIFFSECETHYLLRCIRLLLAEGHRALDVRPHPPIATSRDPAPPWSSADDAARASTRSAPPLCSSSGRKRLRPGETGSDRDDRRLARHRPPHRRVRPARRARRRVGARPPGADRRRRRSRRPHRRPLRALRRVGAGRRRRPARLGRAAVLLLRRSAGLLGEDGRLRHGRPAVDRADGAVPPLAEPRVGASRCRGGHRPTAHPGPAGGLPPDPDRRRAHGEGHRRLTHLAAAAGTGTS